MSTVQEIINAGLQRTDDAVYEAEQFVGELKNISGASYEWQSPQAPNISLNVDGRITSDVPTNNHADLDFYYADLVLNQMNALYPDSVPDADIQSESISDFNFQPEALDIPERPDFVRPQAPDGNVNLDDVTVSLGDAPVPVTETQHDEPAIPDPDSIDFEDFTIEAPELDYAAPTNQFEFVEQEYSSEFRDSLMEVLHDDMVNGGSGINPDDEQALFERARDREAVTYRDNQSQIARQFAARGFKMPTGVMAGLSARARDGFNAAMSGVNRDIMLRRSEMHTQARQFAIQAGTTLDNAKMAYHGSVMERAMNVARYVAQFGIEYHNLQVERFRDSLNLWQTISQVRTQWVDNAVKKTREYELKLEKMNLTDRRNGRRTELMEAMNRAVQVADQIRKADLEVGALQLENNKNRIEQSKLLTQNYSEIMRSNDAAARAYGEAIRAETLRNEPFRLNLEAHREERESKMDKVRMQQVSKDTEVNVQRGNLQRYEMRQQQYFKELDNAIRVASEKAKILGFNIEGWKEKMNAADRTASYELQAARENAELRFREHRAELERIRTDGELIRVTTDTKLSASKAGIGLYESLITGAQSALGTISVLTAEEEA